ncbi:hypothetical protein TCON_1570 [Astathelohania contejeani]|uniref:N-acetyltransferase domain-containing protein n=1 Tax=Astathelohania contejeani TaxID=164912 RepID=A0ABQ7HYH7_9MICR|nr:hypothetical protein TCON_1570 [Thelohania contejeani]
MALVIQIIYSTFICLSSPSNPIKHMCQCNDMYELLYNEFLYKTDDKTESKDRFLYDVNRYTIFQLRNNGKLIGSLFVDEKQYYGTDKAKELKKMTDHYEKPLKCIEIYSLAIVPEYRKQGYARNLLENVVNWYDKNREVDLIALHLDPKDKMMEYAFALYTSLGFHYASFVKDGPSDYFYKAEQIFLLPSPCELVKNPELCNHKGYFFAMYCTRDNFNKNTISISNLTEIGKTLKSILINKLEKNKA